jgi:hypothetical protein
MRKQKMTAGEFGELLEKDPEYVKMRERKEQERFKKEAAFEVECSVFAHECSHFGYYIKTTWDLIGKSIKPEFVPFLIKYLYEPDYSKDFREGIARSLDIPESIPFFNDILDLFSREMENGSPVQWSLACALAAATKKQSDVDIIEQMIYDNKLGVARNALLRVIKKRMKGEQRERTLLFAKEDPELKINLRSYGLR